jgi:hypothetical protein
MESMFAFCVVIPVVGWSLVLLTVAADQMRAAVLGEEEDRKSEEDCDSWKPGSGEGPASKIKRDTRGEGSRLIESTHQRRSLRSRRDWRGGRR